MLALERGEVVGVFRPDLGQLALQPANSSGEIGRELPVATARRVGAFPPGVADRRHDFAGSGEKLRDLFEREWRRLLLRRLVVHVAVGPKGAIAEPAPP